MTEASRTLNMSKVENCEHGNLAGDISWIQDDVGNKRLVGKFVSLHHVFNYIQQLNVLPVTFEEI